MKGTLQRKSAVIFALAAFAVAATALLVVTGCGKKKEEPASEMVRPVKTFKLANTTGQRTIELPGETKAIKEAMLAFEVNGRISELPVKEGDVVKAGQLLARLDQREMKSNLDSALANREAAKSKFERATILNAKRALSDRELESAKREYEVSVAKLDQAQKNFEDTTLKADFNGVIARILVKQFENVAAKANVMVLQDTSEIEVVINVPESRVALWNPNVTFDQLTERAKPVIELTATPGRRFPAKVIAQVNPDTAGARGAIPVPSNALGSDPDGKAFVWRLDPGTMTVTKVPVTIGQASGSMVEVSGELNTADEIVISGVRQLQPGMKIRRWEGTDSAPP